MSNATTENGTPMPRFALGQVFFTRAATTAIVADDAFKALKRHRMGDWGDLDEGDQKANEDALQYGDRLLSAYADRKGVKFWIITEADRNATTVLLPDDY